MALPPDYIDEFKRILASISASLPGYVQRMSQKRMIAAVAEVLSRAEDGALDNEGERQPPPENNTGKSVLCVQGPTGVGKSMGYLIGATVAARAKKRKLVISSATVALQEQLISRDVPLFVNNYGQALTFAIAKGRTRYVCHRKLHNAVGVNDSNEELSFGELWDRKPEEGEIKRLANLLADYEGKRWSGDRDELDSKISDELWARATTDRHGCLNSSCRHYSTCAQMAARAKLKNADIVVANHDLLLADMALGGGVILPSPSETFYVLDEAHHLAGKAVDVFSSRHQVKSGQELMEKLSSTVAKVAQAFRDLNILTAKVVAGAEQLAQSLGEVFVMLDSIDKTQFSENGNLSRFPNNELPAGSEALAGNILLASAEVLTNLLSIQEELRTKKKENEDDLRIERFMTDLGFFVGRVEGIKDTWEALTTPNGNDLSIPPVAKWVVLEQKKAGYDFSICASRVSSADSLARMLFKQANGAILTSATLMTMGNFDQLLRETGLVHLPDTELLALNSPFDFAKQGVLSIPDIGASAKDARAHTAAIITHLPRLIEQTGDRGTLVLFASRRQMTEVADGLPPDVRKKVMIQGERSKEAQLTEHRRLIDSGQASVLFGLQSFAEGLDLPGAYCAHVIITKIPFAVPSDPVQQTLDEWLSKRNRSYFSEVAVPQACLRMIQAAGRLIRTETDSGIVTVLDERLRTTGYGKMIQKSLPPFRVAA